jgi:hypothetical protein
MRSRTKRGISAVAYSPAALKPTWLNGRDNWRIKRRLSPTTLGLTISQERYEGLRNDKRRSVRFPAPTWI